MIKAVIDVGTNSIKFCLAESERRDGSFTVLKDANNIAKLGEGLRESGLISPDALERNALAAAGFVKEAREAGADDIHIVGTMALRTAKNTDAFKRRVNELTGLDIRVIPGEEEAQLSYIAVMSGIHGAAEANLVSFDTGGGSTEFVFGEAGVMKRKFSLNIGGIRITEDYLSETPVPAERLAEARACVRKELSDGGVTPGAEFLVGMGGNVTSIASVKHRMKIYDPDVIQGSKLTLSDIRGQIADYASKTLDERRNIVGLQPKRADVILAGACIVEAAMELCGVEELTVSDRGLRHGLLYKLFKA
ncbi:MAG: Ppx/GppA phosphatase family protein [Synergistaceae bacterium]|nr:Ppx/GppA phosphatase family protein [Synergistaceae bacterium]